MLALAGSPMRLCEGITRRVWLRVGAMPLAGLTLPQLLRDQAASPSRTRPPVPTTGKPLRELYR